MKQVNSFHAHFIQRIHTNDGNNIEVARGELWIKRPDLLHWHVTDPEESFLISDGKTLWFYVPNIKQVTAYCLKNIIDNHFLLKILCNCNTGTWNDYKIFQKKNWFYLKPKWSSHTDLKEYQISITDYGIIDRLKILESDGQCIDYYLFNKHTETINIEKFQFIFSEDIQLDDQRK